ncbi:ATP-grasp fold amidoligase family protein [Myceligenerans cantabricum]
MSRLVAERDAYRRRAVAAEGRAEAAEGDAVAAASRAEKAEHAVRQEKRRVKKARDRIKGLEAGRLASFREYLEAERRVSEQGAESQRTEWERAEESLDPRFALIQKLRGKALVQGLDVALPAIYRTWAAIGEIELSGLPEAFVLKSAGGATSHGVLPLRREGAAYRLISTDQVLGREDVVEHFRRKAAKGRTLAPYFAEEFLTGLSGSEILEDVKVYAFYGEIGQVLLRSVGSHGDATSVRYRYVDENGADLGAISRWRLVDPAVPIPGSLPEMVEIARRLSRAAGVPFVRVDLYETDRGVVFGEFTPRPGGQQDYVPDHDRKLGEMWERARLRLDADVARRIGPVPDASAALRQSAEG